VALALLALACACKKGALAKHEYMYVSAPETSLRDRVATMYNKVGTVHNGDRVEVLEKQRRFLRVRTDGGQEGWIEERSLVTQDVYDAFQKLAQDIQRFLRDRMPEWRSVYPGVESMQVAVMGCVVNGPGESKLADIGISLPGTGEIPVAPVYVDGRKTVTLKGDRIAEEFQQIVSDYVARRYGRSALAASQERA